MEKLPPGKPPEVDARALILAHVDPNLGGLEVPEVGVLDRVEVLEQPVQAPVLLGGRDGPGVGAHAEPVEHVRVEHAGLRHGREGQGDVDLLAAFGVVAGKPEDVIEVGGAARRSS